MDTVYMKDRAYRLVEALRRDNQREQRRLDEKLFSKQGLAAAHQMELLALAEEQRRVKKELSRIRKSTSTTWGLLPPRQGEPDYDEDLLRELSNERLRLEKKERSRRRSHRRGLDQSFSDSDIFGLDGSNNCSDSGPSPREEGQVSSGEGACAAGGVLGGGGGGADGRRTSRRLGRKTLLQLDEENRRTEETLKKFNEVFPTDGSSAAMQTIATEPEVISTDHGSVTVTKIRAKGSLLPLRRLSQSNKNVGKTGLEEGSTERPEETQSAPTSSSLVRRMTSTTMESVISQNGTGNGGVQSMRRRSSSQSVMSPLRKSDGVSKAKRRSSGSTSIVVPRALELLQDDRQVSASESAPRKSSSSSPSVPTGSLQLCPITVVDVQEARDNIVRRLVGTSVNATPTNNSAPSMVAVKRATVASESAVIRPLSPIREQRTELSLVSASMPQFPTFTEPQASDPTIAAASSSKPEVVANTSAPPLKKKAKKKRVDGEQDPEQEQMPKFDSFRYNPDGSLRTMHQMPDFLESLEEAMKARYLRHKEKQWYERELSVNEIFAD